MSEQEDRHYVEPPTNADELIEQIREDKNERPS